MSDFPPVTTEDGTRLYHYAWTSWMWCENEKTVAGDFDDVYDAGVCSVCKEELKNV